MDSALPSDRDVLEERIALWRGYLLRRQSIREVDVDELEDHLRGQASELVRAGLTPDEAFLVAAKRIGDLDALTYEFAREHSDRLWKQLVRSGQSRGRASRAAGTEAAAAVAFAVAAAFGDQGSRTLRVCNGRRERGLLLSKPQLVRAALSRWVFRMEASARSAWMHLSRAGPLSLLLYLPMPMRSRLGRPPEHLLRFTCQSRSGWSSALRIQGTVGATALTA